jgi:hypothetical protein
MTQKKRNAFLRVLAQLFGSDEIYGPSRKNLSTLDIHWMNGVMTVGEYELSEQEAYDVAIAILKRLPKR